MGSGADRVASCEEPGRTILVVDDERAIRAVTVLLLETLGYRALAVEDGASALAALGGGSFDGVLLDLTMPDVSGAEVLERVRQVDPALPVIVMTGHGEPETVKRLRGQRPDGYLAKPFSPEGLERSLRDALAPR